MRVVLVNPPHRTAAISVTPAIVEEERGYNPPLGILYIAAYTQAHTSHTVSVIDAVVEELSWDELRIRIAEFQPNVVGITAMTLTLIDVMEAVATVKTACPEAKVVLGGPHAHLFPEETIGLPGVDFVVLGEGEVVFAELLERIDDEKALRQMRGIVFKSGDEIVNTGLGAAIDELDALPFPARRLVPYTKYSSLLSAGEVVTTLFTSRGCPFKCRFCARPHLGKRFRARSANNVVDEIQQCVEMGIGMFLAYDDTFTVCRQRVIDICDEVLRRKLDIGFDIRARVDTIDEEMLKRLKAAGCQGIHYGVEAGTEKILKALNKGITLQKAKEVFQLTRKHDIPTMAYFMIGNPSETREDIQATFRFMRQLDPDYVHMTVLAPFPGTQVYAEALERGIIPRDVWREFARSPDSSFRLPHWGEFFTREELNALLVEGYKKFYLRPAYVLRQLVKVRSWAELRKKAKAGLGVLSMKTKAQA